MELMSILREPEGRAAVDHLAGQLGISRDQAEAAVASVLPQFAQRLERTTLSRGGVADLVGLLGVAHGAAAQGLELGSPAALAHPDAVAHGNALLEQLLGNKDVSRAVAARASLSSGIGSSIIQMLLPYIAQMVIGSLARKSTGGLGDILSKIPQIGGGSGGSSGAGIPQLPPSRGGGMNLPGFPSGAGLPSGGGATPGGFSLPGPDGMQLPGRTPYGDLSDIIRRGGPAASVGGSPLWRIVRSVFGSLLGFQSRGIVGWLFRLLVMRWGWSFFGGLLRRMLLGR